MGLRIAEAPPASVRDWAVKQIKSIPTYDFYGPDGKSIANQLPKEARLIDGWAEACRTWETYVVTERKDQKKSRDMPAKDAEKLLETDIYIPYGEIPRWRESLAKTLVAVNGPSPVFERFWMFWCNHFTVSTAATNNELLYGPHLRAIRSRMTGSFADLLIDATINPGMTVYLDNHVSVGPHSVEARFSEFGLNENLGREIMELHTMTPASAYSQADVVETALALTGWELYAGVVTDQDGSPGEYGTHFRWQKHEPGTRKVMGKTYKPKGNGSNQALDLLRDFAAHPETAKHIAFKLARHFIADVPPEASVERIRTVFVDSKGDLVNVHTAVIDEVLAHALDHRKFTTPELWLFQSYHLTGAPVPTSLLKWGEECMMFTFREMGQSLDECPQPNGWSDLKQDWVSQELLDRRIRYSNILGHKVDAANVAALSDYCDRLAGKDSDLATRVRRAETGVHATMMVLCSPQFLHI